MEDNQPFILNIGQYFDNEDNNNSICRLAFKPIENFNKNDWCYVRGTYERKLGKVKKCPSNGYGCHGYPCKNDKHYKLDLVWVIR